MAPRGLVSKPMYSFCDDCKSLNAETSRFGHSSSNVGWKPSSAKIRKIVTLLQEIDCHSGKTEKSIIFSQFTGMLDIIGKAFQAEEIKFTRCRITSAQIYV